TRRRSRSSPSQPWSPSQMVQPPNRSASRSASQATRATGSKKAPRWRDRLSRTSARVGAAGAGATGCSRPGPRTLHLPVTPAAPPSDAAFLWNGPAVAATRSRTGRGHASRSQLPPGDEYRRQFPLWRRVRRPSRLIEGTYPASVDEGGYPELGVRRPWEGAPMAQGVDGVGGGEINDLSVPGAAEAVVAAHPGQKNLKHGAL